MVGALWNAATLVGRTERRAVGVLAVLALVQSVIPTASLLVGSHLIDSVIRALGPERDAETTAWYWLGVLGVLTLTGVAAAEASTVCRRLLAGRVARTVQMLVLNQAITLDLSYFEGGEFYDKLRRAERDAGTRPVALINAAAQIGQSAVSLAAAGFVLITLPWFVFPIVVIAAAPGVWFKVRSVRADYELQRLLTPEHRLAQYYSHVLTTVEHAKEMKCFNCSGYLTSLFDRAYRRVYDRDRRIWIAAAVSAVATSAVATSGYVFYYAYLISITIAGRCSVGQLTLYAGAYMQFQRDVNLLMGAVTGLYENGLFIGNLWEYLSLQPTVRRPPAPAILRPRRVTSGLVLREVSFRYPGIGTRVLDRVNLAVNIGECVAVVGPNGSGKSTLAKLLCRLYDPEDGEILLDGVNIREYDPNEYRCLIAAVFQDFSHYHLTARLNIGLGSVAELDNTDRIRSAARASGIDRVIEAFPRGYDEQLGSYFRHARQLSIGEWQKVAIARALIRDAAVLVLDEPTASLDRQSEAQLLRQLRQHAAQKACVIISHRPAAVAIADRIVTIEGGRVVGDRVQVGRSTPTPLRTGTAGQPTL